LLSKSLPNLGKVGNVVMIGLNYVYENCGKIKSQNCKYNGSSTAYLNL
jgi:hypothetical protein